MNCMPPWSWHTLSPAFYCIWCGRNMIQIPRDQKRAWACCVWRYPPLFLPWSHCWVYWICFWVLSLMVPRLFLPKETCSTESYQLISGVNNWSMAAHTVSEYKDHKKENKNKVVQIQEKLHSSVCTSEPEETEMHGMSKKNKLIKNWSSVLSRSCCNSLPAPLALEVDNINVNVTLTLACS